MRLWHYKLVPYLPKKQLVSQWRECLAIYSLFNNTMKSPLVDYIRNYDKEDFIAYVLILVKEFNKRGIKYNRKRFDELVEGYDLNSLKKEDLYKEQITQNPL